MGTCLYTCKAVCMSAYVCVDVCAFVPVCMLHVCVSAYVCMEVREWRHRRQTWRYVMLIRLSFMGGDQLPLINDL